jgi:hypothetical protein
LLTPKSNPTVISRKIRENPNFCFLNYQLNSGFCDGTAVAVQPPREKTSKERKMISRINVLAIAVALFFCRSLIPISNAQQAQIETQASQVIGLAGLKENTKSFQSFGELRSRQGRI